MKNIGRVLAIAAASVVCGVAAVMAALVTLELSLPPADGPTVWSDPFVRAVALLVAGCGALLGFSAALWLLWRTKLPASIPLVFGATVLAAAATGPLGLLGAVPTFAVGIGSMAWCRRRFPRPKGRPLQAID